MATYTGTSADNSWTLVTPGTFTLDGLDGVDTLFMGTSLRSSYVFSKASNGAVHVDSVSGASGVLHATLYNMELLVFNNKTDTLDLRTYFANNAPAGDVTISGQPLQGQKLTAKSTITDADGLGTFSYQWLADGVAIKNATTSTLILTEAQVGKAISVNVSYVDGHGTAESVSSAATDLVVNVNDAPTGTLAITGTATQGEKLSIVNTLSDPDGMGTVSYRWLADGVAISGQTDSSITLAEQQVGRKVVAEASYVDGHGTTEIVSSSPTLAVANVNDLPQGVVKISGKIIVGERLTVDTIGLTDADGLGLLNYQWLADSVNITGATKNEMLLTSDLVGRAIQVQVQYVDGHGTLETVLSSATSVVNVAGTIPSNIAGVSGHIGYWPNKQLNLQSVEVAVAGKITQSDALGTVNWSLSDVASTGTVNLSLSKSAPSNAIASSISLNDVLSALKIYLGKELPAAYNSSYNYVAADFDANGRVDLSDILSLLKFYLGKTGSSAVQPSWVFIDLTDDVVGNALSDVKIIAQDGQNVSKVNTYPHTVDHDFSLNSTIDIVGVLRGDVDGSWTP